jgi:hypothetical protein
MKTPDKDKDEEDEFSHAWEQAVAQDWATDWSDPQEDIYSLNDGEALDDPS